MNKRIKNTWALLFAAALLSCSGTRNLPAEGSFEIIPRPREVVEKEGKPFLLDASTQIVYPGGNESLKRTASFLAAYIRDATGRLPEISTAKPHGNYISLKTGNATGNPEGYRLVSSPEGITITGDTEAGTFYGVQTLRMAIPAEATGRNVSLPAAVVTDFPRFHYRGVHLDVARHFFPVDSVKRFIDILALSKENTFHWHLSDDQGWRIEIKKYPGLTETGSRRKHTVIGRNSGTYDDTPYGGFYTQDEIRDVVAYAAERHMTIIPEIDLPGHMLAALSAYPEYGCTGGPYETAATWGVFDDVLCAGNEQTMQFMEDVLEEVIGLFPAPYIHIGGDECPKTRWKTCPKCQARIKAEGLKADGVHSAEDRLQSYVITRMEQFVNSKGRRIIGWDEILEGGLAPDATVMSWRGMGGGTEAARQKHDVIMTPTFPLYFDYYQSLDTGNEPLAGGGYNSMEHVYAFDPVPASLSEEEKKHIIGAQANIWTEYIPSYAHVEYMLLPRLAALSEVQWSSPERKNYGDFLIRLKRILDLYGQQGYNFAKHVYDVSARYMSDPEKGVLTVTLETLGENPIHYTLDGTEPTAESPVYTEPLQISGDAGFRAAVIGPDFRSRILKEDIAFSLSSLKPVTLKEQPGKGYVFEGAQELVNGLSGGENYKSGRWLGFQGRDVDAVIDLGKPTAVRSVSFNTNVVKGDWIMGPSGVTVKGSGDGRTFREIASVSIPELKQSDMDGLYPHTIGFDEQTVRYLQVIIRGGRLPAWHPGAGRPAYIFVDEIAVR